MENDVVVEVAKSFGGGLYEGVECLKGRNRNKSGVETDRTGKTRRACGL